MSADSYPSLEVQHDIVAHPANCICIEFDPTGRHFAVGSADALLSVWDAQQLMCRHTVSRWAPGSQCPAVVAAAARESVCGRRWSDEPVSPSVVTEAVAA